MLELSESTNSKAGTVNKNNFLRVKEDWSEPLCEHVVLEGCNDFFSNDKSTKIVGQTVEDTLEEKYDLMLDSDNPFFSEKATSPRSL